MTYRIRGLDPAQFASRFAMDEGALAASLSQRLTADVEGRYPCRVSLEDAAPGEELLLTNFTNHAVENEAWPLGPRDAMTGLPPWSGGDLYFSRIYSHPLDEAGNAAGEDHHRAAAKKAIDGLRLDKAGDNGGKAPVKP